MDDSWIGKRVAALGSPGVVFIVEAIYPGTLAVAVRDARNVERDGEHSMVKFPDMTLYAGEYWRLDAEPDEMEYQEAFALRDRAVAELKGDGDGVPE